jgi:KaiC/GvpD/RAD55 family RecA-like ATPase
MPESNLVKTGIKGLDEVLFGGIPRGNITLVTGIAGTGKTTLGVEFVYRGASQFNEPGMIVLFEVAPDKLIRDAALFGWDLRALERDGRLRMVFTTRQLFQQELQRADSPLLAEAAEIGARRIFVDGLIRLPGPDGGDGRDGFHLLAAGLHRENLRVELGDTFRHALTVAKMRAMPTSRTTHECEVVNGQGMKVLPRPLRATLPVAPFAGYLGLLSRAPERRTPPIAPETP